MKTPRKRKPMKMSPRSGKDEKQTSEKTPKETPNQRYSQQKKMRAISELNSLREQYAKSTKPKVVISAAVATRKNWNAEATGSYHIALPVIQKDDPEDRAFYHENGVGNIVFKACSSHPFRYTTGIALPYEFAMGLRARACKACKWNELNLISTSSQVYMDRPEGTPLKSKDKQERESQEKDTDSESEAESEGDESTEEDEGIPKKAPKAKK